MVVLLVLLPKSAIAADPFVDLASKDGSLGGAPYAKHVHESEEGRRNDKVLPLSRHNVEDSSDKSNSREMSLMIGILARHVDQSDNPNENLRMVVASYDNIVVSRYINTWDDPTYFGGKRFSSNKYPIHNSDNFFLPGKCVCRHSLRLWEQCGDKPERAGTCSVSNYWNRI